MTQALVLPFSGIRWLWLMKKSCQNEEEDLEFKVDKVEGNNKEDFVENNVSNVDDIISNVRTSTPQRWKQCFQRQRWKQLVENIISNSVCPLV